MSFRQIIKEMVETSGGKAGLLMGKDGITVCDYVQEADSYDIERVGVEYNKVIEEIKNITMNLDFGDLEEINLVTHKYRILVRPLDKDYFLALALDPKVFIGKARFIIRKTALKTNKEL